MINRPCPSKVNCGVCPEFASPWENLSSEAPDPIDFIAMGFYQWTPPINGGSNNVGGTGGQYNWLGNYTVDMGVSPVNQQQAQQQANRNAFNNAVNPRGRSTTQTVYGNTAQTVTIPCSGGGDFTYTVPPDTYVALDQGLADSIALQAAQEAAPAAQVCITTASVPSSCANESYSATLAATGGTLFESGFYLWQVTSGSLPDGLSLDPETGGISGTPTTTGAYSFTVTVADAFFNTNAKNFTLTVAEITTSTLPSGIVGTAYNQTISASPAGGTFALVSGALPDGLVLDATGLIHETPLAGSNGDYSLPISYTVGGVSCIKTLTLKIWDSANDDLGDKFFSAGDAPIVVSAGLTEGLYELRYTSGNFICGLANPLGGNRYVTGTALAYTITLGSYGDVPGLSAGTCNATTPAGDIVAMEAASIGLKLSFEVAPAGSGLLLLSQSFTSGCLNGDGFPETQAGGPIHWRLWRVAKP